MSYLPAGKSIFLACHSSLCRIALSIAAIDTFEKSWVSTPSQVERERSCDLPVISTRPIGESLRSLNPPFEPTQIVECVCSA